MKKLISFAFAIAFVLMSFASCKEKPNNIEVTSDIITEQLETEADVSKETVKLSEFNIVYKDFTNENVMNATSLLKEKIGKKTGITLSCKRAKEEKRYEILVGNTGRELSNEYFSDLGETIKMQGYLIKDGKVFIAGVDQYTFEKSIDAFINDYITDKDEITIENQKNALVFIDLEEEKLSPKPAEGTLRIVSHNIIRMNLKYQAFAYRVDQLQILYGLLDADILSLDECDELWFSDFGLDESLQKLGYELAPIESKVSEWTGNENCECRILYKKSKFSLVASGSEIFESEKKDEGINWYGWALLEEKSSGKRLVVFSNHFWGNDQGKLKQAQQLLEYVGQIEAVGYPVIATGDFNATITSGSMSKLRSRMASARHDAEIKVNMNYATVNADGTGGPAKIGNAIDHCFYSKNGINGKYYETVIGYYSHISSDHLPIVFDFVLE